MNAPELTLFGPMAKLTPFELEQQVLMKNFVVFATTTTYGRELTEEVIKRLKKFGVQTISGEGDAPNFLSFIANRKHYSSVTEFTAYVTEFDKDNEAKIQADLLKAQKT